MKWLGKCGDCGAWNSFVEETITTGAAHDKSIAAVKDQFRTSSPHPQVVALDADLSDGTGNKSQRIPTGSAELDRVLGGGLTPDSFVLIGGDPGIGKSTLLLQVAQGVLKTLDRVLIVSGEESVEQIQNRAKRLGVEVEGKAFLACETQLERVFEIVKQVKPQVLIMDSLQTFATQYSESAPGTVSQVREVSSRLMTLAKTAHINVWLVGHVTKDGSIAGPKIVEHLVDTVLYFEGDQGQSLRLLRTVKNRFGNTNELGVFEMTSEGLVDVPNPSALFLNERSHDAHGTAITATIEGSRPLLVELQALCVASPFATPRRTSVGLDSQKLGLLTAVLEKHAEQTLVGQDLYFNVAGGLKLTETACDLAAVVAIYSAIREIKIPPSHVFLGEVGLTGDVRKINQLEVRLDEAKKLGFTVAFVPKSQMDRAKKAKGIELVPLGRVREIPDLLERR